jgi:excisionase family DNA binding protein
MSLRMRVYVSDAVEINQARREAVVLDTRRNLSLPDAARRLGISPHTLRAWTRQGRLSHLKAGRRVLFTPDDLEAFEARCRVPAREGAAL